MPLILILNVFAWQLSKRHRKGRMRKVDWLDRLTFREIEMVNEVSLYVFQLLPKARRIIQYLTQCCTMLYCIVVFCILKYHSSFILLPFPVLLSTPVSLFWYLNSSCCAIWTLSNLPINFQRKDYCKKMKPMNSGVFLEVFDLHLNDVIHYLLLQQPECTVYYLSKYHHIHSRLKHS